MDYRAFVDGREEPSQRNMSWLCEIQDRFDVEYYAGHERDRGIDVDSVCTQIDTGIADTREHLDYLSTVAQLLDDVEVDTIEVGDLLEEMKVRRQVEPEREYRLLGVRWWGGGPFVTEHKPGSEIHANPLYEVLAGSLIYNRLFAWRAAFAVLEYEHDGCYVSNEFPTFAVREGVSNASLVKLFIVHCMNGPYYTAIVDAQSTGSTKTSRTRPNQQEFLSTRIAMPKSVDDRRTAVALLQRADDDRKRIRIVCVSSFVI